MKFFSKRLDINFGKMTLVGQTVEDLTRYAKSVHGTQYAEALDHTTDYLLRSFDPNVGTMANYAKTVCSRVRPILKTEAAILEEELGLPEQLIQTDTYSLSGSEEGCGRAVLEILLSDRRFMEGGALTAGVGSFQDRLEANYDLPQIVDVLERLMEEDIPRARAIYSLASEGRLKKADSTRLVKSYSDQHRILQGEDGALTVKSKRRLGVKNIYKLDSGLLMSDIRRVLVEDNKMTHLSEFGVLCGSAVGGVNIGVETSVSESANSVVAAYLSRSALKLVGAFNGDSWYVVSKADSLAAGIEIPGGVARIQGIKVEMEEILC